MSSASYQNHQHYLAEGWSPEPKESFKQLRSIIANRRPMSGLRVLDIGCATGELLGYLSQQIENGECYGVDVASELIVKARQVLPSAHFYISSALDLPIEFNGSFDVVCAIGCMSIFDELQLEMFWDGLFRVCRTGGLIIVLSPLNEFGVDAVIRHRKRADASLGLWETGWNIYSTETIRDLVAARGGHLEVEPFRIGFHLPRRKDQIRTWTVETPRNPFQLTNGLKLLVDHEFMIVEKV